MIIIRRVDASNGSKFETNDISMGEVLGQIPLTDTTVLVCLDSFSTKTHHASCIKKN
jgi:hypothetical protein